MTERGPGDGERQHVDDLRRQLRALGYLDAGVDRFVLGPAVDARRPAVIALLASARVGLVAALLLGPAAAVGIGARIPGLVTGPRDAAVAAAYLGLVSGIAVMAVTFGASLLLALASGPTIARRARVVSLAGGILVTIACLAYLTLWWRMANPGPAWSSPVWTAIALAVAVAISLLLGHAVNVMALTVVMARHPSAADLSPLRRAAAGSYWKLSFAAGALAFAGAAVLLAAATRAETRRAAPPPPLTVVSSGLRVRVIAVDGFDKTVAARLAADGLVPSLAAALAGARADFAPDDPRDPARTWTTIATGQPPEIHGVFGLETRRVAGMQGTVQPAAPSRAARVVQAATDLIQLTRPALASGEERRAKTMWDVSAESGLHTVVVNWWATWPAPVHGAATVLTDRAALRLELGGPLDAEVAPAGLYERLRARWADIRARTTKRTAILSSLPGLGESAAIVRRSAELDALQLTMAEEVRGTNADLVTVYLPGLDIAQHTLLGNAGTLPASASASASAVAERVEALRTYYVFLDHLLRESLRAGTGELVFLIAHPGRVATPAGGLLTVTGTAARSGAQLAGRVTDVAPTILYALGLPHSRELAGQPLRELFVADHLARYPTREVPTYGPPSAPTAPRSGQPLDEAMLERLRSLGYVR